MALSDLVRDIKNASSNLINSKGWVLGRFCWQEGFGAFSYAQSQISDRHPLHPKPNRNTTLKRSFRDEYLLLLLKRFEIDHDRAVHLQGRAPGAGLNV